MAPTKQADSNTYFGHHDEIDVDGATRPYASDLPRSSDRTQGEAEDAIELWYPDADRTVTMTPSGKYEAGYPMGAVIHCTEGYSKKGDDNAKDTMLDGESKGFCYFCISSSGRVYQPAALDSWGSHSGSTYHPVLGTSLSRLLVGIEVCNAGLLAKTKDGWKPKDFSGPKWLETFSDDELRYSEKVHNLTEAGTYHAMTAAQEDALTNLLVWMHGNNPDVFKLENVFGHDEIAVSKDTTTLGRKQDPGASLSMYMPHFREKLLGVLPTS